jgi:predicted transcriptional regulator
MCQAVAGDVQRQPAGHRPRASPAPKTPIDGRPFGGHGAAVAAKEVPLGDLERSVLDLLWRDGEKDAKAVHATLGVRRGIGLNTIQSTLKRLFDKGLLVREKVSHAHLYSPRASKADFHRARLDALVRQVGRGDAGLLVSAFVDFAERAGDEHLAELERLVAERRRSLKERR